MLRTWYRSGTFGFESMSILPTVTLPAYSVANASIAGAIRLHGPHHSAQKSTRTGAPDFRTVSSKFPSVNVCTCSFAIDFHPQPRVFHYQPRAILMARSYILTYSFAE